MRSAWVSLRTTCWGVCRFLVAIGIVLPAHKTWGGRLSLNVDQPTGVRAAATRWNPQRNGMSHSCSPNSSGPRGAASRQRASQGVAVWPHADPAAPAIDVEPSVPVRPDGAGERIAVVWPGARHHVGIEAPAFASVHRGIDPQRRRAVASHALTLSTSTDTDTDRPRRIAGRDGRAGSRVLRRVGHGTGRT